MGCRIIVGHQEHRDGTEAAVFYCSTTDWAFGPVMNSQEEAEGFLQWLPRDPRVYLDGELESLYHKFVTLFVCECGAVREEDTPEPEADIRYRCDDCKGKK